MEQSGPDSSRDQLVMRYAPLVRQVAGRVGSRLPAHVELADLVQAGVFGLMDAIERFEPSMGVQFEAYASQRIRGAILDELRAQDWVPRVVRNRARELERVREVLEARLQRGATQAELADELGVGSDEVRSILEQIRLISMEALDTWAAEHGGAISVAERLEEVDSDPLVQWEAKETNRLLAQSLTRLPERDHQVLFLYYVRNLTLAEIGRRLGVTESRVCQLRARAVARLRNQFIELTGLEPARP
ncbi:MAG TPA: FliA/WhiG family RNA polymerase sigma factor [Pseudonocardia sp.]